MVKRHEVIRGRWVIHGMFRRSENPVWKVKVRDRRKRRYHYITTGKVKEREARQAIHDWIEEYERKEAMNPIAKGMLFEKAFGEWLEEKSVRPSTMADYKKTFDRVLTRFHKIYVDDIDRGDIRKFLRDLRHDRGNSERTIQKHLGMLRSFFEWCIDHEALGLPRNPTRGFKVGKVGGKKGKALTVEEARRLVAKCGEPIVHEISDCRRKQGEQRWNPPGHLLLAVVIALETGLRRSNIVNLRWECVDLVRARISIPGSEMKAGEDHEIPIHQELLELLRRRLRSLERPPMSYDLVLGMKAAGMSTSYRTALERAELPPRRWHDLRHTFATWMASRCSFACLRTLMAHGKRSVTEGYIHVPWEERQEAISRLPRLLEASRSSFNASTGF